MTSQANFGDDFASAEAIIRYVAEHPLSKHPLVLQIGRTESAGLLWLLVSNTYHGTSVHFAAWLASVTAIVEDERCRCLLARQLNEEMGDGDISRAHSHLMTDFLTAIEPLRPLHVDPSWTAPGRELGRTLEQHYLSRDQFEAMATLMAGEICAHQLIASVGQLLKPHLAQVDTSRLTWLIHHNEVEGGHADESLVLARFVPNNPAAIASVARGALGLHRALWQSMDELQASWQRA